MPMATRSRVFIKDPCLSRADRYPIDLARFVLERDRHIHESPNDFGVGHRVRRWSQCTKGSAAGERHRNQQLVREVSAHRDSCAQVLFGLITRVRSHLLGAHTLYSKPCDNLNYRFALDHDHQHVAWPNRRVDAFNSTKRSLQSKAFPYDAQLALRDV